MKEFTRYGGETEVQGWHLTKERCGCTGAQRRQRTSCL